MQYEFDIHQWNMNKFKLLKKYPELTTADLIWRHETKSELFRTIADKLGMTQKGFEEIVENY
jgi:hypothetical protein